MASLHATAQVIGGLDTNGDNALSGQDAQEYLQSLCHLVSLRDQLFDADTRPAKRRRTSKENAHSAYSVSTEDIVLLDASVDLYFGDHSLAASNRNDAATPRRVPIKILCCEETDEHHILKLAISDKCRGAGEYTLLVSTDRLDEIATHLNNVSDVARHINSHSSLPSSMLADASLAETGDGMYHLSAKIVCPACDTAPIRSVMARRVYPQVLDFYCPEPATTLRQSNSISLQSFYDCVHRPDPDEVPLEAIQHPSVKTELYPFQRRTVSWLLERERARLQDDGSVTETLQANNTLPYSFSQHLDTEGRPIYVSSLLRRVVRSIQQTDSSHLRLHGGILCEEMGLGKTVELLSLFCLHRRTAELGQVVRDAYSDEDVTISSATLIVTPPAILEQWLSEIRLHTPTLKVWHYKGVQKSEENIHEILVEQDIVITSYNVLAHEVHYADKKPDRNLRHKKQHVVRRSPLVKILWWRVCLDEAQMVESGVSSAAVVARRIPRCNAWAVSGTPLRKETKDLLGLLKFLRLEPFCTDQIWDRMSEYPRIFQQIFKSIALRHTKADVREELEIPLQRRVVVTIPFTAIEEQHYKELFEEMCSDICLDRMGAPIEDDWDPDDEGMVQKMRQWLTRLRQTCLHPEVGERNKRALGRKMGPLRTVEEVLKVMIDQNESVLRLEERAAIIAKMVQGHLYSFAKGADKDKALHHYLQAFEAATAAVIECREQLREASLTEASTEVLKQQLPDPDTDGKDDALDKLNVHRSRLRNAHELQHASTFFVATAYYQIRMQMLHSDEQSQEYKEKENLEAEYYEIAKNIRAEILREATKKTKALIEKVKATGNSKYYSLPPVQSQLVSGGIESQKVFRAVDGITDLLNAQSRQIYEWRTQLIDLLSTSLLDQDDVELTGEEYDATLLNQDEQYVYLFVLRTLVADRHELLTGHVNTLVEHEVREALKVADEDQGHAPGLMKLTLQSRQTLVPKRNDKKPVPDNEQSMRGLMTDLRNIVASLRANGGGRGGSRAALEAEILETELQRLQRLNLEQTKGLATLEKDIDMYRSTMNSRLEYYRQVQAISDTVKPYQAEESNALDETKLRSEQLVEQRQLDKVSGLRTKRRFLMHLQSQKAGLEERRPCTICMQPFESGVLTVCAHEFCKDCISLWMSQHHSCPVCKKWLRINDLHDITYKPREMQAQEERQAPSPMSFADDSDSSSKESIYTSISEEALNEIKTVDIPSSWGSKIDAIARHLLYLRASDPGSKTVIFSQYQEFLHVLSSALHRCKIKYSGMRGKNGIQQFKQDVSVECFFLHAKADASGLNLVNATHVILCEPLINTAVELQAISRVHRIGQCRPTTVWMYIVSGTVEEAIYEISVSRRLNYLGSNPAATSREASRADTPALESRLDAANSLTLQSAPFSRLLAKGASGGEIVAKDDLWRCLFGKARNETSEEMDAQMEAVVDRHLRAEAAGERAGGTRQH